MSDFSSCSCGTCSSGSCSCFSDFDSCSSSYSSTCPEECIYSCADSKSYSCCDCCPCKGEKGDKGDKGDIGATGSKGDPGIEVSSFDINASFNDLVTDIDIRDVLLGSTGGVSLEGIRVIRQGNVAYIRIPSFRVVSYMPLIPLTSSCEIVGGIPVGLEPEYQNSVEISGYNNGVDSPLRIEINPSGTIKLVSISGALNTPFGISPGNDITLYYLTK